MSAFCPHCGKSALKGAPFCPHCGKPLDPSAPTAAGSPSAPAAPRNPLVYVIPGIATVALLVFMAMQSARDEGPAPGSPGAPPFAGATGGPMGGPMGGGGSGSVDIASMTPQERAARLFDRVMRYASEGKQDSVAIFAPMALQSMEMLGELDAHGRYDRGLLAVVAGQPDVARNDAKAILAGNPDHLLGLLLQARVAAAENDKGGELKAKSHFLRVLNAEKAKALDEYQAHAQDIDASAKEFGQK